MQIRLGDIAVDVVQKNIKNIHLSVHPPLGKVRIAAPLHLKADTIRVFALSKLGWIKRQQEKLRKQAREAPREMVNRESHYVWGQRYLLKVVIANAPPEVTLTHNTLLMCLRPGSGRAKRQEVIEEWYRRQLKTAIPPLLVKWGRLMRIAAPDFSVRRMKTKWGSCIPSSKMIVLNLELAKKPRECLEYIVVHELAHLIEPTHNVRFVALMDRFMPKWQFYRDELNRLPVRHEHWVY